MRACIGRTVLSTWFVGVILRDPPTGSQLCTFVIIASGSARMQVLLSLPAVTPAMVGELEQFLRRSGSGKEQRGALRKLLLLSGEGGQLKALFQGKTTMMTSPTANSDKGEPYTPYRLWDGC